MTRTPSEPGPSAAPAGDVVIRVPEGRMVEAIMRLYGMGPSARAAATRFIEHAGRHGIRLDATWARLDHTGRIVDVVLAVPNPGRTVLLFIGPPAGVDGVPPLGRLVDHAVRASGPALGARLAQALVEPGDAGSRSALLAGGLEELATLGYLERPVSGGGLAGPPLPAGAVVEAWREGDERDPVRRAELCAVLEASYVDTLDCPGLQGRRPTEDILEGHLGSGRFEAPLWMLLRVEGTARGALLFNPQTTGDSIELVYLGVDHRVRGAGLGGAFLREGLRRIAGRPEPAVTLAVDERNRPALRLYRGLGFHRTARRIALVRDVPAADECA